MNWNIFKVYNGYYAQCSAHSCYKYALGEKLEDFIRRFSLVGFVYNYYDEKLYCRECHQKNKKEIKQ